jgi:hypothetical protein
MQRTSQRTVILSTLLLGSALLACKQGEDKAAPSSEPAAPAVAAPAETEVKKAPEPQDPALSGPAKPKFTIASVPDIPDAKSNPPQGTEWDQGVPVNTQGASARAKQCSMHILRDWLRIYCAGKVVGYEKKEDFGELGQDHYEKFVEGKYASLVIRLRKGKTQKIRICREGNRASLFVSWPPSADKPKHVALGDGPECDGSDWGVGYGKGGQARKAQSAGSVSDDEANYGVDILKLAQDDCRQGNQDACRYACGKASCN